MRTKELEERLLKIEEAIKSGATSFGSPTEPVKEPEPKKEKTKRAPSAYNLFMKDELARLKKEQGSDFDRKEAFKVVAKSWSDKKGEKSESGNWFS